MEGADIAAKGWEGRTALNWAAKYEHTQVVELLKKRTTITGNANDDHES